MLSSLSVILSHIVLLHMVRKAVKNSSRLGDSAKGVLISGICAFELGCVCLEQGVLLQHYGILTWAVSLLLFVIWQVSGWEGVSANPLGHIMEGSMLGAARVLFMLAGSLLSYRHMAIIWNADVTGLHKGRAFAISTGVCALPWKDKAIFIVILTELVGTFLLTIIPRYILEHKSLANNDPHQVYRGALIGLAVLVIVLAGMDHSGAMYNPTLATLLVGDCVGFSRIQHFVVYWLTPVLSEPYWPPCFTIGWTRTFK